MRARFPIAAVGCMALVLAGNVAFGQRGPGEYQVKAAFLYNFAKFVEWPGAAFQQGDSPFVICLAGDPFDDHLERMVQGELLDGRPILLRQSPVGADLRMCQAVYVPLSEARRGAGIVKAVAGLPILTVGESEDFIDSGGIIRFVEVGNRIRFQINPDAAERASLRVSSRLLRLAEIVRPRQAGGR